MQFNRNAFRIEVAKVMLALAAFIQTAIGFAYAPSGRVLVRQARIDGITRLYEGDVVQLGAKSDVKVMIVSGSRRFTLIGPYKGKVVKTGLTDIVGKATALPSLDGPPQKGTPSDQSAGVIVRGGDLTVQFKEVYPFGLIQVNELSIEWTGEIQADRFLVRISDPDADTETWMKSIPAPSGERTAEAGVTRWRVTASGLKLSPSKTYKVAITAIVADQPAGDAESSIKTCSKELQDEIDLALHEDHKRQGLADFLEAWGLRCEAGLLLAGSDDPQDRDHSRRLLAYGKVKS